jgi:hypothetical protein
VHHTVIANARADGLKLWAGDTVVENVLIYGAGDGEPNNGPWASLVVGAERPGRFALTHVTIDDNEGRNRGYPVYMQYESVVPIEVTMRNCIIAHGPGSIFLGPSVTLHAAHNLFYRSGDRSEVVLTAKGRDWLPSELAGLGPGNLSEEPQFVRRAWGQSGDYHLQPTSPARDHGLAGSTGNDLKGTPRPVGAGVDMGAYEQ